MIVDEAHRLSGSTDQIARYKLGKKLAEAAPYVLLVSPTPHQGKSDAFHRLMYLLADDAFPDMDSASGEHCRAGPGHPDVRVRTPGHPRGQGHIGAAPEQSGVLPLPVPRDDR